MILRSNLPRLRQAAAAAETVLDVGGWFQPFNLATHVIDLQPYATRHAAHALDPEDGERFDEATWVTRDVCEAPWPFPDKFFAFSVCSHLLEDVRDPLTVCRELLRVSRAGYIETPSRLREIFAKARWFRWKALLGNVPEVGFCHHRWLVELDGTHLSFTAKTTALLERRRNFLTRAELGRKLTEAESGMGLFWQDGFSFEERFVELAEDYPAFRRRALAALRR